MGVLSQIPQRAVTAWIEDGIKIVGLKGIQPVGSGKQLLRLRIAAKTARGVGLRVRLITFGI